MKRLAELADSPPGDDPVDVAEAMLAINVEAVALMPSAQYAGITVLEEDDTVTSLGPTHRLATLLDVVHHEIGEGPCFVAARGHEVVRIDDVHSDERWPAFRRALMSRTPVRSILCVQLVGVEPQLAALHFQADAPDAFDDESAELALALAAHATMAWNVRLREEQFSSALDSRDIIGQAKGMLMERFGIDAMAAFELLKRMSQENNVKLAAVAESVVTLTHPRAGQEAG
ncbi:GAF and ANTAR domain-containing protein [Mycobacterium sp. NPDC003323]